jgi:glyoxylase-like metal-dependent hydrolase (beta-lactamase superfamily II)
MKVSKNIVLVDTEPLGYRGAVAAYIVKGKNKIAFIDTGFPLEKEKLLLKLKNSKVDPREIDYILITHTHLDHMGSAYNLLEMSKKARIIVSERGSRYLKMPVRVVYGSRMVFGEDFMKHFTKVDPVPGERIDIVRGEESISLGGGVELRTIETPGHSPDHMSFFEESSKSLFTGDAVCNYFRELPVFVPPASPPAYPPGLVIGSLEKLKAIRPNMILTPHFGLIDIDSDDYFNYNIDSIMSWGKKIQEMLDEGKNFIQITEYFKDYILKKSGKSLEELPPYFKDVFFPKMVRITVMGYMTTLLYNIK